MRTTTNSSVQPYLCDPKRNFNRQEISSFLPLNDYRCSRVFTMRIWRSHETDSFNPWRQESCNRNKGISFSGHPSSPLPCHLQSVNSCPMSSYFHVFGVSHLASNAQRSRRSSKSMTEKTLHDLAKMKEPIEPVQAGFWMHSPAKGCKKKKHHWLVQWFFLTYFLAISPILWIIHTTLISLLMYLLVEIICLR